MIRCNLWCFSFCFALFLSAICLMSRLWNERSTIFYYLGLLTKRDLKKLSV